MRVPMIAGNWKMNTDVTEGTALASDLVSRLGMIDSVEIVLCPPFISLTRVKEVLGRSTLKLGAQNAHSEEKGAFTGEVSPAMLNGLCDYVIIGHSERRQYFCEDNETVNKKLQAALRFGLKPIMCVGEKAEENETGQTEDVLSRQLSEGLRAIPAGTGIVIAYEPIWAIGTGRAATAEQAQQTVAFIRHQIKDIWGVSGATATRILYGGSVTAANSAELLQKQDIDGALVGGASLKVNEFVAIVNNALPNRNIT